jgi:hypothetical protein
MNVQKYIGILSVVTGIAALGSTASAIVPCDRTIPTGGFHCGTSRAEAHLSGANVVYLVASNGRTVNGVPVTVNGARVPKLGGGTCPQIFAGNSGQTTNKTCPMLRAGDAKRYIVNQL